MPDPNLSHDQGKVNSLCSKQTQHIEFWLIQLVFNEAQPDEFCSIAQYRITNAKDLDNPSAVYHVSIFYCFLSECLI